MINARCLFLCGALFVALVATDLCADGAYQRVKDGKTLIWNPDPKPGDIATWSGGRDADRYASGSGTLTWYRVERKYGIGMRVPTTKDIPLIQYSGNMVRGKLEGTVVALDRGKTFHATFVNGIRSGEWAAGPAATPEQPSANPEHSPAVAAATSTATGPPLPGSGATGDRVEPDQPNAVAEVPVEAAPVPSPVPEQTSRDESVRRDVVDVPPERSSPAAPSPLGKQLLPLQSSSEIVREPGRAADPANQLSQLAPATGADQTARRQVSKRSATRKRPQADDFLQSLALPPSSLKFGMSLLAGTSPQPSTPAASSPPPDPALLTTEDVLRLADAEARANSYLLSDYQPPQAEYNPADGTWSVSYEQRPVDGTAETAKPFRIKVEDKTKKTSIITGR